MLVFKILHKQSNVGIQESLRWTHNKYKIDTVLPKIPVKVRFMKEEDIPYVMELRRQVRVHDVATFLQSWMKIDPEGMFVASTEDGKIIGAVSMVQNHHDLYMGGLYCVHEKYRNQGVGSHLCKCVIPRFQGKIVLGNSVLHMTEKYIKAGHLHYIDENLTTLKNYIPNQENFNVLSNKDLPDNIEIEPFQISLLRSIVQYDASVVGFERAQMLELSCQEKDSETFVAFRNGACIGYGSIKRSCLGAGRVSPLFADDPTVAEGLLKKLLESYPNRNGFAMMTLKKNEFASSLIRKLGNPEIETCMRIYSKAKIEFDTNRIFALTDMNLCAI
ncbi:n-acetyltransferase domain-containing protein [Trichonephila inaurata madagascariensis]|uniref:N-acetyltransferase domain-containing protein n=1 Tax=Trichonephila inaurata madagascariensis TaxID=2747483 RepID=A0A8X6KK23_9ARAC|nr:n-acetyltransferase domain-containing protein [Trichonephila inaurata madagascariensis]